MKLGVPRNPRVIERRRFAKAYSIVGLLLKDSGRWWWCYNNIKERAVRVNSPSPCGGAHAPRRGVPSPPRKPSPRPRAACDGLNHQRKIRESQRKSGREGKEIRQGPKRSPEIREDQLRGKICRRRRHTLASTSTFVGLRVASGSAFSARRHERAG